MLLNDIATYLAANSTALTVGATGNLLKAQLLDNIPANTAVALYETGGSATAQSFSTGAGAAREYEEPGLQVLSRSTSYVTARTNAETVFTLLDGFTGTLPTATGRTYLSVDAVQSPASVGRDRNDRWLISTNYRVRKVIG